MGVLGANRGRSGAILTPNELIFPFESIECSYVCANFGENGSRNATVGVLADGHTDTLTNFIICPMLYAIAIGQITKSVKKVGKKLCKGSGRQSLVSSYIH